jgi:hypothetical protein
MKKILQNENGRRHQNRYGATNKSKSRECWWQDDGRFAKMDGTLVVFKTRHQFTNGMTNARHAVTKMSSLLDADSKGNNIGTHRMKHHSGLCLAFPCNCNTIQYMNNGQDRASIADI